MEHMDRLIKMTTTAQQALWSQTTGGPHIPTQFIIEGDHEEGYRILAANDDLSAIEICGRVRTLRFCKAIIKDINEKGVSKYRNMPYLFTVGTFAWANHPIPQTKTV
jgi:hypothetical protein